MKLSKATRGMYLKFNSLVFCALGNNQFILAMAGDAMRRGPSICDMDLPEITKEEYMSVAKLAYHGDDWHSKALFMAVDHGIEINELQLTT